MLHKLTSSYREIAKYFPELQGKLSASSHKKQLLLEMAGRGEPRPPRKITIGTALSIYTVKSSSCYDPIFDKKIRKLRPDWFVTQSEMADRNKKFLLKIASEGEPRPTHKVFLGPNLSEYTSKSSKCYDPTFDKEIRKLRPDWFVTQTEKTDEKKRILLDMAKKGEPRPDFKTSIGTALSTYLGKSSGCYDPIFANDIQKIRPDWFRAEHKKKLLMKMASNGDSKPNFKSPLGIALRGYTRKSSSSYNPIFDKEIRKLRPDWFVTQSERADEKKRLLLKMARKGEPKPTKNHLCMALQHYTAKLSRSYDLAFDKEIRKIRPDWFVTKTDVADKKKRLLLEMASKEKPRPNGKSKLGASLSSYTRESGSCYDPAFNKEIRKLRPDWFTTKAEVANKKKGLLLCMARKGRPRPTQTTPLGRVLSSYTSPKSTSYDPMFAKNITKLRSDWFVLQTEKADYKKELLLKLARKGESRPNRTNPLGKCLSSYLRRDPYFHKELKKIAPDWFVSKSEKKKRLLLSEAGENGERPNYKTALGMALSSYTVKSSDCYDPLFTRDIKKLAPNWFQKRIAK